MKAFTGSLIFTLVCLLLAGVLGYVENGGFGPALSMVFVAAVLGAMETSLSLDNAVVNAAILRDMDPIWQRRFLTWGILIAVFGMRIVFPILIVSVAAMVSPWEAARIAVMDHRLYEQIVTGAHIGISGFGGAFLMLVGLGFFLDPDREHHWLGFIEKPLAACARLPLASYVATLAVLAGFSRLLSGPEQMTFLYAGVGGVVAYVLVQLLGASMGGQADEATGVVARSGLATFVYLEFLDASFSFDGVIGAFAITNDILLIALGLGIGAMFVRSMTVALVHGGHLSQYRYLEPGAFHAILALSVIMFLSVRVHVPEVVTGLIGAVIIGLSLWASIRHRRRFPQEYEDSQGETIMPSGDVVHGAPRG